MKFMSLSLAFFFSCCAIVHFIPAAAQLSPAILKKIIQIDSKEIRMDSLVKTFQQQTGVGFSYNSKIINPSRKIKVDAQKLSFNAWLIFLSQKNGLAYKVVGNHIIFLSGTTSRPPLKKTYITKSQVRPSAVISKKQQTKNSLVRARPVLETPTKQPQFAISVPRIDTIQNTKPSLDEGFINKPISNNLLKTSQEPKAVTDIDTVITLKPDTNLVKDFATDNASLSSENLIELGPGGFGIGRQQKISRVFLVDVSIGLGGSYFITGQEFTYKLKGPGLYALINPKVYYNLNKRLSKGKSINLNSGNYFGFRTKYVRDITADSVRLSSALLFSFHWGLQRSIGDRFTFSAQAGPGYGFDADYLWGLNHAYPSLDIKLNYIFKKRKSIRQ